MSDRPSPRRVAGRLLRRLGLERSRPQPDYRYVFIVTYGRSGSTLLQGVLNSLPGYLVRGENRQAMRHLWEFHRTAVRERDRQRTGRERRGLPPGGHPPTDAYYGIDEFPVRRSLAGIRALALDTLLRPEPGTRVTGFKEIRWDDEDVAAYVTWLRKVFPGARFVVNTRSLDDVAQSRWWADDPGARERLEAVEARLLELRESLGEAAFHVRYDDYVADPAALRPLMDWLGEAYDEERLREVLATRHSY
ncbi:sulfotransferase [Nocardioides coralli]|uniref:sulfotransferase n=1 Tax=Nocardioides coralli TaxID=2872154 RepID=UPI001CA462EA|nr:sulfotransferase [Nocardioides coralli]QZY27663.1 sulfotransferase [Nocardioides coralli]